MNGKIWARIGFFAIAGLAIAYWNTQASSHREAPLITSTPKLDCSDLYLFSSYEAGRSDFVTIIANYVPLQDAYGGPNYFTLDPNAVYEIHVDNTGDAVEDLTFRFRFTNTIKNIALPIGPADNVMNNAVPVINVGLITAADTSALNVIETYRIDLITGPRRSGTVSPIVDMETGSAEFEKPADHIGTKSIPDYEAYSRARIFSIRIPGCDTPGRVFVGQRKDPFVVNLGETFDLVNISNSPFTPVDANRDSLFYKNVTSLILELPKECLVSGQESVIAAWTTASRVTNDGNEITHTQLSRLGNPLVNEVVIGLGDKDKFNASEPKDDGANFLQYVTHPTLPAIIELLYGGAGVKAPTQFPREDLVAVFLTGLSGLNELGVGEMLRLNTETPAVPPAEQNNLRVVGGDSAGFPNGRRPGDDVVDIALRVVMGLLLPEDSAPSGQLPFSDGAVVNASFFDDEFPYLRSPLPGSPLDPSITITLQSAVGLAGPFQNVAADYDPASRKLNAVKPDENTGFFRLKTDGKAELDGIAVDNDSVQIGVK